MRSSYKTTVKYLLKSGEVFAISFLQSFFSFFGYLIKVQQVIHSWDRQGRKSYRVQRNGEEMPASQLCKRHNTAVGSTHMLCASGSTGVQ